MRKIVRLLCIFAIIACATASHSQDQQYDFTSVDQLKKALSSATAAETAAGKDADTKDKTRAYIIKMWLDDRMIAAAEYEDDLKHAVDSWYANDRDWRKIPAETWSKLRDSDKGRLKLGIDPEAPCLTSASRH